MFGDNPPKARELTDGVEVSWPSYFEILPEERMEGTVSERMVAATAYLLRHRLAKWFQAELEYSASLRAYQLVVVNYYRTDDPKLEHEVGLMGHFRTRDLAHLNPMAGATVRWVQQVKDAFAAWEAEHLCECGIYHSTKYGEAMH